MKRLQLIIRLIILSLLLIYLVREYPEFYPFPHITAKFTSVLLNLVNINSISKNTYLLVEFPEISRILELSAECSGIVIFSMFALVAFLVPGFKMKHRIFALPLIPLLFLGNVIRIFIGIIVGYYISPSFLVFFHDTLGQIFIFLFALIIYIIWLRIGGAFPREHKQYNSKLRF